MHVTVAVRVGVRHAVVLGHALPLCVRVELRVRNAVRLVIVHYHALAFGIAAHHDVTLACWHCDRHYKWQRVRHHVALAQHVAVLVWHAQRVAFVVIQCVLDAHLDELPFAVALANNDAVQHRVGVVFCEWRGDGDNCDALRVSKHLVLSVHVPVCDLHVLHFRVALALCELCRISLRLRVALPLRIALARALDDCVALLDALRLLAPLSERLVHGLADHVRLPFVVQERQCHELA